MNPDRKRLLALDGGGIRGLITVEVLAGLERTLQSELRRGPDFRLAEYFDYVAGTSTGAIIAACVSLGMSVDEIRSFYLANGEAMFDKASLLKRFRYKYEDDRLAETLRKVFDDYLPPQERAAGKAHVTLGSKALRTLLLVVMRNATTDSPWPLSNNPKAKYNDPTRPDCNLEIPLWRLVRASTAAPTYFPPEAVPMGPKSFLFVDGGITTYNNPAFMLFLMSTVSSYKLCWPTGTDRMLLLSIGTGTSPDANDSLAAGEMNLVYNASTIPSALMFAALNEQDLLCRVFGNCRFGGMLDREVGTLMPPDEPVLPKLFSYARYNVELTRDGLDGLGLKDIRPEEVQKLDSLEHMKDLTRIGARLGAQVAPEHLAGFLD
jgi:hypothetical protein